MRVSGAIITRCDNESPATVIGVNKLVSAMSANEPQNPELGNAANASSHPSTTKIVFFKKSYTVKSS
jgi:hypothetical protein